MTTYVKPTTSTISGKALAYRKISKRQRAHLGADLLAGRSHLVTPTAKQIAALVGVSASFLSLACQSSRKSQS
jgi:hypothetical protein